MACASADECDVQICLPSSHGSDSSDNCCHCQEGSGQGRLLVLQIPRHFWFPWHLVMPEKMAEATCLTSFIYSTNGRGESTVFRPHSLLVSTPAEFMS